MRHCSVLQLADILLTGGGHIKVGDFGSALLVRDRTSSKSTKSTAENKDENKDKDASRRDDTTVNSFMGSSEYVSPEVLRDQQGTLLFDLSLLVVVRYFMFSQGQNMSIVLKIVRAPQ